MDDDAVVYVNGRKVGAHKGWNEEFELDVAQAMTCGERNLVAVLADNSGGGGAGIWKPVSLVLTEELARLQDYTPEGIRAGGSHFLINQIVKPFQGNMENIAELLGEASPVGIGGMQSNDNSKGPPS